MIHYSCDLCGCPIGSEEVRFEVKIEVRVAGVCPEEDDEDDDEGPDLEEILEEAEEREGEDGDVYRVFRYDLCCDCHQAYLSDPLSRTRRLGMRHMEN